MNWLILSLPLVISVSLSGSVLAVMIGSLFIRPSDNIPVLQKDRGPDISVVEKALARVFSEVQEEEEQEEVIIEEEEEVDIKLIGVVAGEVNMAMLRVGDSSIILHKGESKKGVLLKDVWDRGAIVSYRGRDITLRLKKRSIGKSAGSEEPAVSIEDSGVARISRREIERLTKDPGIMFRELRLVPYVRNGRTEGFIFEWIRPGSLLHRAGLRRGDILLSINNNTIRSGEDAFRLLQILRNEPNLRILVMRNGVRKELKVVIE